MELVKTAVLGPTSRHIKPRAGLRTQTLKNVVLLQGLVPSKSAMTGKKIPSKWE